MYDAKRSSVAGVAGSLSPITPTMHYLQSGCLVMIGETTREVEVEKTTLKFFGGFLFGIFIHCTSRTESTEQNPFCYANGTFCHREISKPALASVMAILLAHTSFENSPFAVTSNDAEKYDFSLTYALYAG